MTDDSISGTGGRGAGRPGDSSDGPTEPLPGAGATPGRSATGGTGSSGSAGSPGGAGASSETGAGGGGSAPGRGRGSRRTGEGGRVGDGSPDAAATRRRRLVVGGVIGAAVLIVVLGCLAAGAVLRSGARLADRAEQSERRSDRAEQACVELETRLNRLVPPGATGGDPRRRAAAIRAENAALRPYLDEILQARREWRDRDRRDDDRDGADPWLALVSARTAYAEALERQSPSDPAFFVAPQTSRGKPVVDLLERASSAQCGGAIRRLAHPDL